MHNHHLICFISIIIVSFIVDGHGKTIGGSADELPQCSEYYFENKVLEKLVRMEHLMELSQIQMKELEKKIDEKLKYMYDENMKKTEALVTFQNETDVATKKQQTDLESVSNNSPSSTRNLTNEILQEDTVCLNGGTYLIWKCVCADGFVGDMCEYSDGKERQFILVSHFLVASPTPRLLVAADDNATLNIYNFHDKINHLVTISASEPVYDLSKNVIMEKGNHQRPAGVIINSDIPIRVYAHFVSFMSEGLLVIPTKYLSTHYIIPSFFPGMYQSEIVITPLYNDTVINILLKLSEGSLELNGTIYTDEQMINVTIQQFTTLQLYYQGDFTGTLISASKPIAVVSGNDCNFINDMSNLCSHLTEMVLPINQLDNVYVIPRFVYHSNSTVRVVAVNSSELIFHGEKRISMNVKSREFLDFYHQNISIILASDDVIVTVYPHEALGKWDEAMLTVPGINQYLYDHEFVVPAEYESYISITVPTYFVEGFMMDGKAVTFSDTFRISEKTHDFTSFAVPITSGFHRLEHRNRVRFGVWVYGYAESDAYGFPAGIAFKTT